MKCPHHRPAVPPVVAVVDPLNVMPAAHAVLARMENIWAVHKCAAWLFVDDCCRARVLHDNQMSLPRWQRMYLDHLVGCYTRRGQISVFRIANDMDAHLVERMLADQWRRDGGLIVCAADAR